MASYSSDLVEKILDKLNKLDDKERKVIVDYYIDKAKERVESMNFDSDTIGYQSEINGYMQNFTNLDEYQEMHILGTPFWLGFIPNDKKIVYCFEIKNCAISNSGYYYYIDDYNYLYEFAKYIKNKRIVNDLTFMVNVHEFIYKYFNTLNEPITREQLHHLIYNVNDMFYEPFKEHNITDFKGNGSAKCSEYAAMFQNILSVFGYDTVYIHGELDDDEEKHSCHAFNMTVIDDEYSLVDISMPIACYNYSNKAKKRYPYIYCLDGFSEDDLDEFLLGEKELVVDDLEAQIMNDQCYTFCKTKKRVYRVDQLHMFDEEETLYNNKKIVL